MKEYRYYFLFILVSIIFFGCGNNNKSFSSLEKNLPISDSTWVKVADCLKFPEGPAWDISSNSIYFSNCYGGWISKVSGNIHDIFLVVTDKKFSFEKTNGMTFHNDYLYACDFGKGMILKISREGEIDIYAKGYKGEKFNRPNDLAFDKKGNLYFTDPKSYGKDKPDGRIFMIDATSKEVTLLQDSLSFPNGIAFSSNGRKLFVCESAKSRILSFDVQDEGTITNKEEFLVLSGGDPDGIAFDNNGNLFIAHFGTGHLFVVNPDGIVIQKIKTPGNKPTNIEFGGKDMRTLYLTEVETNSLFRLNLNNPGMKLF